MTDRASALCALDALFQDLACAIFRCLPPAAAHEGLTREVQLASADAVDDGGAVYRGDGVCTQPLCTLVCQSVASRARCCQVRGCVQNDPPEIAR